jgi:hypothetical protein
VRVALPSCRSKEHCSGQGIYVRHLSRDLVELGAARGRRKLPVARSYQDVISATRGIAPVLT